MTTAKTFLLSEEPSVFVVHEDPAIGRMLKPVVKALQAKLEPFASLQELLEASVTDRPGCLLFVQPATQDGGFAWLAQLSGQGVHLPVVVLSTSVDVPRIVQAMRAGARNFLKRPCAAAELQEALRDALTWDAEHRQQQAEQLRIRRRLARLTTGEYDVLRLLVDGKSNRQVADTLQVSVRAVEVRRAKLMQKMKAESLAELVRLALTVLPEQLPTGA
ncbi:MAG: LuxR C-terminal-related transcriptional regulator [Thermoguttaceae bacterium]|jgi:FixJ family two-component response regulator